MSTRDLHQRLLDKDATLAVIGLGYVCLLYTSDAADE